LLNIGPLLTAGLLYSALCFAAAICLMSAELSARPLRSPKAALAVYVLAMIATWLLLSGSPAIVVPFVISIVLALVTLGAMRDFSPGGRLLLLGYLQLTFWGTPWGVWFIATIPVSDITRVLMFSAYPMVVLTLPVGLVSTFEGWEVLCRQYWRRPRTALPVTSRSRYPKVSIHVPACSEPPEVVIATLNAIAHLDYPNIEVLVIDNNTHDDALWRPVEEHCRSLGSHFRFFHLPHCEGAKGEALNFALDNTAPDAELIAVVDSDYIAEPQFLSALLGHFDDPRVGFVQTPHDYRDWGRSRYLRWCRWEYKYFFDTTMVSLNERDAAIIVGTMCIIRRSALVEAGGWSEWCLTEDSELAIRIHAMGYSSVYVQETFGRGLIPETFSGYKRQRFRWTYGPIQELKEHLGLFLPRPLGRRSALTVAHKIEHLNHGLDRLNIGLGLLLMPLGVSVITSMLVHGEVVGVPRALWIAATVVLAGDFALKWLAYKMMGCPWRDAAGALLASRALNHTIAMASISALFARPARWQRTNKFKLLPNGFAAMNAVRAELLIGLGALVFAATVFSLMPRSGMLTMLLIGVVYQSFNYLSAPVFSALGEHDLSREQRRRRSGRASAPAPMAKRARERA